MLDIDWTLPVALVSIIIFLILMNRILFKPMMQLIDARNKGIHNDLQEATHLRQQAEGALTTYESALGAARREMMEQAGAVQRAMEARQREQIDAARREANTMVAGAQATIGGEAREALRFLPGEGPETAR